MEIMTTAEETVHDEYLVPSTSSEIIINDFFSSVPPFIVHSCSPYHLHKLMLNHGLLITYHSSNSGNPKLY